MTNLNEMKSTELKEMAKTLGVKNWWLLKKADLITGIEELQKPEVVEEPAKEIVIDMVNNTWKEKAQEGITEDITADAEEPEEDSEEPADENIITLKELIHKMGIKGTKARRLLRNSDIERPYKRWEWHKEKHKDIIEKVKGLLK